MFISVAQAPVRSVAQTHLRTDSRCVGTHCFRLIVADRDIGALIVLSEGKLVGILSERDYARKVVLQGKSAHDIPVREIMTPDVVSITPEQTVEDCMTLMTERHVRHLPVKENESVAGLISIGDVVKSIISQHEHLIQQLEGYISGK